MAEKPKAAGKPKAKPETEQFVSKKEFDGAVNLILDRLEAMGTKKVDAPVTVEEKKIIAAAPNNVTVNPDWDATAKDILGEYLDHTEVEHTKSGGILFTVVIKMEKSNAASQYLQDVKIDRRTKEVGAQGLEGVTEWCRLIRANLKRSETK